MRRQILFIILPAVFLSHFLSAQMINIYHKTGSNSFKVSDVDSINFLPLQGGVSAAMNVFTKSGINSFKILEIDSISLSQSAGGQAITMDVITRTGTPSFRVSDIDSIKFLSGVGETVKDIDGNEYRTITIGAQVWMAENLRTTRYRNGDSIPNVTDHNAWDILSSGAYCDYGNYPLMAEIFGKLYNWYAVKDQRGLAPAGWHIPTRTEWEILVNYLGGESVAGGKIKETGYIHWGTQNLEATNESGFTGLPGGMRYDQGGFTLRDMRGSWWSANEYNLTKANNKIANYENGHFYTYQYPKQSGMSIRCVKD